METIDRCNLIQIGSAMSLGRGGTAEIIYFFQKPPLKIRAKVTTYEEIHQQKSVSELSPDAETQHQQAPTQ